MCASQQDVDTQRRPARLPQLHTLSLPSPGTPSRSYILLTFRPPPRKPLPGTERGQQPDRAQPDRAQAPVAHDGSTRDAGTRAHDGSTRDAGTRAHDGSTRDAGTRASGTASAAPDTGSLLDAGLLIVGAALVLAARATLTRKWAWSWHAGSGATFTLSRMHGVCTSAMGELAQGASGMVASHCLWVDGSWTAAVLLAAAGCILATIGIARMLRGVGKTA